MQLLTPLFHLKPKPPVASCSCYLVDAQVIIHRNRLSFQRNEVPSRTPVVHRQDVITYEENKTSHFSNTKTIQTVKIILRKKFKTREKNSTRLHLGLMKLY